jgi:hypothetical protein
MDDGQQTTADSKERSTVFLMATEMKAENHILY